MKRSLALSLFLIGAMFLLFAGIQVAEYRAESKPEPDRAALYYSECRTAELVRRVAGSLTGCFGSWLLLLYLRIRKLERQIPELQRIGSQNDLSRKSKRGRS
jgi:hypothetical protein